MRTRVKICGITRPEDAVAAAALGADAIGLVFYAKSPRAVTPEQARAIRAALPPFVNIVGLFVDAERAYIRSILEQVAVDTLQFHGAEPPKDCSGFGRPCIKAIRMRQDVDLTEMASCYLKASGLLLDSFSEHAPGGTGERFDWSRVPTDLGKPVIVAGGLTPENVGEAVTRLRPYAVDVSSGVESAPGIKDHVKMAAFVDAVAAANAA